MSSPSRRPGVALWRHRVDMQRVLNSRATWPFIFFSHPWRNEGFMAMTLGPINPETQGKNPLGLGVWVLIREHFGFRYWEEDDTWKLFIKWILCQVVTSIPRILQEILFMKLRQESLHLLTSDHSSDSTSTLRRAAKSSRKKKKKRCTEENTQGTRKWQLKGTQEAKPLSLIYSKPIRGMAWLWHSVFKRWESWDRKEIQIVIIQSRYENFLAMELFLQMKSPGAPVVKGGEKDSHSLSCLRVPVLHSQFPLEDSSRQHRGAGDPEWWAHSWGRRTPTCYHHANPKIKGTSAE